MLREICLVEVENGISFAKIAEHLDVCKYVIYRWFTERDMLVVKERKPWEFLVSELDAWFASGGAYQESNHPKEATDLRERHDAERFIMSKKELEK